MKAAALFYNKEHGQLPTLLLGLTLVTGLVDAISILALGRVFVANMTGNIVFIGLAVAHAPGFSLISSLLALLGFLVGAAVGGRLIGQYGKDRGKLFAVLCISEFVFIIGALIIGLNLNLDLSNPTIGVGQYSLSILLAVMMGMQNAVVRKLAVPDMTTTVLTMTLTGIAADIRQSGWHSIQLARRILAVLAMLIGAFVGAELILNNSLALAIALVAAVLLVTSVGALVSVNKPGEWRTAGE